MLDVVGCLYFIFWGVGFSDVVFIEVVFFLGSCVGELGRNKSIVVVGVVVFFLVVVIFDVGGYLWFFFCCDVFLVVFEFMFLFFNLDGVCG